MAEPKVIVQEILPLTTSGGMIITTIVGLIRQLPFGASYRLSIVYAGNRTPVGTWLVDVRQDGKMTVAVTSDDMKIGSKVVDVLVAQNLIAPPEEKKDNIPASSSSFSLSLPVLLVAGLAIVLIMRN
jgi:hypothetical protein